MLSKLAYIGLGSNLLQPAQQVRGALQALARTPDFELVAQSSIYRSAPLPTSDGLPQPDYCNAVCCVRTALAPQAVLDVLLSIERKAGRIRDGQRWAPRILDLDLLHMEGVSMDTPELTLPHPGISTRNFVLVPLAEIAPELVIPAVGAIAERARTAGFKGLQLV